MICYKLIHIHDIDDYSDPDVKKLGFFSTIQNVEKAISFFSNLPGFCSYPNGFIITEHKLCYNKNFQKLFVYELCTSIHDKKWNYEYESTIGIYPTRQRALEAKQNFIRLNNIKNTILNSKLSKQIWIEQKCIDEKSLFWSEGFD